MALTELERALLRVREARALRAHAGVSAQPIAAGAAPAIGCRFAPGMHVFDRVSGEIGVVIRAYCENVVVTPPERQDD